jgi:CRISPR/Cas system-associated exonuclease Cas4 (RecB family)
MSLDFLEHLSYSSIKAYETCPRCWWLKYKYGYEVPSSDALDLGSDVHKMVEKYHKEQKLPEDEVLQSFLKPYSELYLSNHYDEVELSFTVILESPLNEKDVLPIPFVGIIDRVWKNNLHDLKTSARRYSDKNIKQTHQHSLYCYGYEQVYGKKPNKFIYDVLVKNKTPVLQIVELDVKKPDIHNALMWVWNNWKRMNNLEMPKHHTPRCWNKDYMP